MKKEKYSGEVLDAYRQQQAQEWETVSKAASELLDNARCEIKDNVLKGFHPSSIRIIFMKGGIIAVDYLNRRKIFDRIRWNNKRDLKWFRKKVQVAFSDYKFNCFPSLRLFFNSLKYSSRQDDLMWSAFIAG